MTVEIVYAKGKGDIIQETLSYIVLREKELLKLLEKKKAWRFFFLIAQCVFAQGGIPPHLLVPK